MLKYLALTTAHRVTLIFRDYQRIVVCFAEGIILITAKIDEVQTERSGARS
ncbi:hypothetical protein SAMN02745903_03520 [Pseudomonas sp. URMO17WK12:I5]|nr:hypothetical protein H040_03910 [Pseudomonas sp. URMO17WK12:I7]SMF43804.1 hypothetical protein SAMN02745903_03520 [Pseudomonas sp. URMO17WK12:I5]